MGRAEIPHGPLDPSENLRIGIVFHDVIFRKCLALWLSRSPNNGNSYIPELGDLEFDREVNK